MIGICIISPVKYLQYQLQFSLRLFIYFKNTIILMIFFDNFYLKFLYPGKRNLFIIEIYNLYYKYFKFFKSLTVYIHLVNYIDLVVQ